ncbi:hypothetical protein WME82_48645 [Sorangium sp. So ce128]
MEPDALPCRAALEELGALHVGRLQVLAEAIGVVCLADALAVLVHEQGRAAVAGAVAAQVAPRAQRADDAGRERPRARIVRLVFVQHEGAALEVRIRAVERGRFAEARPFTVEEAVEQAPAQRDVRAGEQARILVRVEPPLRLARAELREEALGQRVRGDEAGREERDREQPVHELRDVAPRRRGELRQRPHDVLRVVQRERGDRDRTDDRVDVALEPVDVVVDAALRLHVVGVKARQLARRPELAERLERHVGRQRDQPCGAVRRAYLGIPSAERVGGFEHRVERLPVALRRALDQPARHVLGDVRGGAQLQGEVGQDPEPRDRLLLRRACRESDARARRRADLDPRVPAPAALVDVPCSFPGHRRAPPT